MTAIRRTLPAWQWQTRTAFQAPRNNLNLQLALPLLVLGGLLAVLGLFSMQGPMLGLGVIGVVAALGLQRAGTRAAGTQAFERNVAPHQA